MSDLVRVLETHKIKCHLPLDREGIRGGFIVGSEYVWFTNGADIVLYSKTTGCVESSRSFIGDAQIDNSIEITFVQELHKSEETMNMLLVGCSCKSFGILFVCQLPTLTIIRCIHIPSPISYISTINNESLAHDQLCDKFKAMSTVLLVGVITGAVYAVDLRKRHIENQLRNNEIVVNESSPSKLFILRKNDDFREAKKICDHSDFHLAMFINEKFCNFYKRQCSGILNFNISCLLYTEEINAVAIGYITGHFQLWDCKNMQTLYVLKKPECNMPITHITFLEQADVPNNLCYLWIIQSDNSRIPNAMMISLSYEHRIMMSNGRCSYRVYKEYNIKLKMLLRRETGIGRCISALTLCNDTVDRKSIGVSLDCGITLFAMLMEIRQNVDTSPKSYVFLFDINQWNKAQMPSIINHIKISNSYACFVKLPNYASYLDFNISNKTLRPFGSNFRNNFNILHYPSSIYFECECLLDTKIIRFKHVGVQQEVLDKLILNSWSLFENPNLIFCQCLQTNLKPLFWDKTYDYKNYTLLDKLNFVVSIIVENNIMSVFDECVKKWKNGTHSELIILNSVECLWNHVMLVKQYADQLCVPLFNGSGAMVRKNNVMMLNECLSQMLSVENIFKRMQFTDCVQIINVDLVIRMKILNLVTQYFNAIIYFLNLQMLPKPIEEYPTRQIILCDFTSLIQYANKRRLEFGNLPLYLIDAIVTNEPNGNKLIEQWKQECIEETKGLYPPTSVQSLLRIYLNAELSNRVKDFITIYFLIDVSSVQKMNEITANIFNDTFVKNEELYKLCCASWLFDHDMFEDAMLILASNNEWMVNEKSWNWYHWTVLKLFVFKKQYYWAQIYLELFDIKLVNLDNHKFYVNLQIMNNHCFDALCHLNSRKIEEKMILFEYIFDRCRHTNQLKTFLSYPLDPDEKKLFFSCLKKFEDTKLIQFMFLVQEKRYSEALELSKSLKVKTNSNHDYILTMANVLVGKIKDNISSNNKNDLNKKVFSNEEIKMTFMNRFIDNHINMKESNTFRSYGDLCQINLIVPDDDLVDKTQGLGEKVSTINGVLSTSKMETVNQVENKLLKLLDTPFIHDISTLPSVTSVAVPKKKSAIDNMLLSTINLDKAFQTLTFGLPDNIDSKVDKFSHEEGMSMKNIIPDYVNVRYSDTNNLPINMVTEQSPITFHKLIKDNSKIKLLETAPIPYTVDKEEYEQIGISDNDPSVLPDGEYKHFFEELDVLLDSAIDKNNSEELNNILEVEIDDSLKESDVILGGEIYEHVKKPDIILDDDIESINMSIENHLDETNILPDSENEDNSEEPDFILDDENYYNRLEQPDVLLKGDIGKNLKESEFILNEYKSVENNSDQLSVTPDVENEDNFEEPYVLLEGENYEYVEEPYIILGDSNFTKNSEQPDNVFNDDISVENHPDIILPNVQIEDNLKESGVILKGENYDYAEKPDIILDNSNDTNNSEQPNDLHDENISLENYSDQHSVIPDSENEDNLEESDDLLDVTNFHTNSKQPYDLHNENVSVENHSDQLSIEPDGENEDNLEESDVIQEGENYEYDVEEPDIILDDSNYTKNSVQPDDSQDEDISVENHSDQLSIEPDGENEDNLEKSDDSRDEYVSVENHSDQLSIEPDDVNEDNLEESDDSRDEYVSVENHSDQLSIEPDDVNEDNFEESGDLLDDANYHTNSKQPYDLHDENISVENHSDKLSGIPDGENEDNLEESDVIQESENYEYDLKESDIILNDSNYTKNSEQPDDLQDENVSVENHSDQLSIEPDGENEDNLEESDVIQESENYVYDLKEPDIILDDSNYTKNSEQPDDLQDEDVSVENHSNQLSIKPDDVNEDNFEESSDLLDDANYHTNSKQPDDLQDEKVSVENHSDKLSGIPDGDYEDNLEESDVIQESENYVYDLKESDIILNDSNYTKNSEQPDDLQDEDVSVENHSNQLSIEPDDVNEDNFEESGDLLDDANYHTNSKQPYDLHDENVSVENHSDQLSIEPDGENEDNLEESDVIQESENYVYDLKESDIILNDSNYTKNSEQPDDLQDEDVSVENHSNQLSIEPDDVNEENFEESGDLLDDANYHTNSKQPDDLQDENVSVENHSDKLSGIPDGENEDNLEESDDLHDENVSLENHSDKLSGIPDGENEDNFEESDDLHDENVSAENHSDKLSGIPDSENEDNLGESDVILESANKENSEEAYAREQNIITSFETLISEKTPENNVMVDHDNVICLKGSQSNVLENFTPNMYGLTEENRSNDDNQIITIEKEKENENYLGNIVDGDRTSVVIKEVDIAEVVENTERYNKPSTPINFQIVENPKEDLCNDQNEDYLYDEYQFSNNYILSELSTIEFNPIPEYGFNHLTMTGNESNQLEMYETNQPTSVLLNESFFNNISLGTTGDVIETQDTVVDNNIEIVVDKISENVEPSSSNTTINTNLYNKEIKSYQLVESKDIAFQQVDTNILNSAKKEHEVEIQNSCPSAASEPSKTLIIKEFSTNSMLYKDILIQEETSKLVNFIKSNSGIESGKNLAENIHNLSTDKKNEQPFIEQKTKNIPNLRKRRYGTQCVPCSDTKLTTKSMTESKTKQVKLKIISSNISSPTSDVLEDCLVSTSKKRPKCQKKFALIKRRRTCPKYVASKYRASNSNINLEQISEESSTNKDINVKKIEELLPKNLHNKDTESLEELTKLAMPIKIKPEAKNNNIILNRNVISRTKNINHKFFLEPRVILKKFDVSLYKNRFKLLAMDNNNSHVSLSTNKTNSQKPIALKRLKKGCLTSMKEPTAANTIINLEELKEDSINIDKNKDVTKKSKLNSYMIKKVELDKNLKSSSDRRVVTLSPDPINCLNKIHNSLIEETINLISDDEFVSDKVQEEMCEISSDKAKLDWRIISHEVKTNTNAIPKIRIGRNKSELNTISVGSQLDFDAVKRSSTVVLEQELGLIKKSSESKKLKFNQQVYRRSSRKILKKKKCSCCTNKLMDDVCGSNVL